MAKSNQEKASSTLPKSLRKGGLPRPVADVWAAGIGALSQAKKKGGDSFEALIDIGTTVAETGGKAARMAVAQVESAASSVTAATFIIHLSYLGMGFLLPASYEVLKLV